MNTVAAILMTMVAVLILIKLGVYFELTEGTREFNVIENGWVVDIHILI